MLNIITLCKGGRTWLPDPRDNTKILQVETVGRIDGEIIHVIQACSTVEEEKEEEIFNIDHLHPALQNQMILEFGTKYPNSHAMVHYPKSDPVVYKFRLTASLRIDTKNEYKPYIEVHNCEYTQNWTGDKEQYLNCYCMTLCSFCDRMRLVSELQYCTFKQNPVFTNGNDGYITKYVCPDCVCALDGFIQNRSGLDIKEPCEE